MLYVNKITGDASQQLTLTGIPGISIDINLRFLPRMQMWMMDLVYNDIAINGLIITTMPNILQAFRNILPFGIACLTENGIDPYRASDFVNEAANLYLLDSADVAALEEGMFT